VTGITVDPKDAPRIENPVSTASPQGARRRRGDHALSTSWTVEETLADGKKFAQAIHEIMPFLHDVAWLASHPLAIPAARARQNQSRRSGRRQRFATEASYTPEYLGESLAERIRSAIRTLEPSSVRRRPLAANGTAATNGHAPTEPNSDGTVHVRQRVERATRRAKVMRMRYIDNQDIPAIIVALNIGRSEYFRLQADGLKMVAELLRRAWDTSVRPYGDHAPAEPRADALLAVDPDLRTGGVTRFIGREQEIADVSRIASTSRLVTILGAPGAGKTRLALEVARRLGPSFSGGTVVISLAELDHESRVLPTIGRGFDIYDVTALELQSELVVALQGQRTLLVLDNFEHILGAGAQVARLVSGVPSLWVLVTSRAPLVVSG
jgi:ATP-dependent Clp protease ATP-binding subunit ClpA